VQFSSVGGSDCHDCTAQDYANWNKQVQQVGRHQLGASPTSVPGVPSSSDVSPPTSVPNCTCCTPNVSSPTNVPSADHGGPTTHVNCHGPATRSDYRFRDGRFRPMGRICSVSIDRSYANFRGKKDGFTAIHATASPFRVIMPECFAGCCVANGEHCYNGLVGRVCGLYIYIYIHTHIYIYVCV